MGRHIGSRQHLAGAGCHVADVTALDAAELDHDFDDPDYHHDHVTGHENATVESSRNEEFTSYYRSQSQTLDGDTVSGWTGWGKNAFGDNRADVTIHSTFNEPGGTETFDYTQHSEGESKFQEDWTQPVGGTLTGGVSVDWGTNFWNFCQFALKTGQ